MSQYLLIIIVVVIIVSAVVGSKYAKKTEIDNTKFNHTKNDNEKQVKKN